MFRLSIHKQYIIMSSDFDPIETIDLGDSNGNTPKPLPNSTAVLVLGILSILGCFCYGIVGLILGIVALVLHKKDKELYLSNPTVYENSFKNSRAGYICAIIGLILGALYFLFFVGIFAMGAFDAYNTPYRGF